MSSPVFLSTMRQICSIAGIDKLNHSLDFQGFFACLDFKKAVAFNNVPSHVKSRDLKYINTENTNHYNADKVYHFLLFTDISISIHFLFYVSRIVLKHHKILI